MANPTLRDAGIAEEYHQKYLKKNPNGYDCHSSTGVTYPLTGASDGIERAKA